MALRAELPSYDRPPVGEVVLSVQFQRLAGLQIHHLGLLWERMFSHRYPAVETRPPIEPVTEVFGARRRRSEVQIELVEAPVLPRAWFVSSDGRDLVQVQPDRFVINWRRLDAEDTYPRYKYVRDRLEDEYARFCGFVDELGLGPIQPNQCEVTYINQIDSSATWTHHGEASKALACLAPPLKDGFLPTPESVRLVLQYLIPGGSAETQPRGRLYVDVQPAFAVPDGRPVFAMNLTARGAPLGDGVDGVLGFMDVGHEHIVRGFSELTTNDIQREWGRHEHG